MGQTRQVWRTTSPNEAIVISICPGYYFGATYDSFKMDVKWDENDPAIDSYTSTDPTQLVTISHTFATPGDHEVFMMGGWAEHDTWNANHGRRKLAYPIEAHRTGDESIDRLIRWRHTRSSGVTRSTRLQRWQLDPVTGDPLPGEVGPEMTTVSEFYMAGQGTFKNYVNMGNIGANIRPIYSLDPAMLIEHSDDPDARIDMTECFMNCGELEGINLWSFRAQEDRSGPGLGQISDMTRCFKNAIKPLLTDYKHSITVGRKTETQEVTLADGTKTTIQIVTDPGVTTWHDSAGTERTRAVMKIWTWGVSRCETFTECFDGSGVRYLDLSRWHVGSAKNLDHMFRGLKLERLNLGRNGSFGNQWQLGNVTSMRGTFQDCDTEDLLIVRPPGHKDEGKTVSEFRKSDYYYLKDLPILDVGNVTDFTDCFRDSNMNPDLSQWDADNAIVFEDFRTGGALIDEHMPDFTFPHADIEIEDFTGDKDDQYVHVSMVHTSKWAWAVNDGTTNEEPTTNTTVKLTDMRYGLNTLSMSAFDVEDNLDEIEFNYVLALTSVDTQIDTDSCPAVIIEDLQANGQSLDIDVSLHNADGWQYSVENTNIQNVVPGTLSTTLNGLPFGTNVILLSALDAAGELLSTSQTVVVIGTGAGGGGGSGGGGTPGGSGNIWFNPDAKPSPIPTDATAELGVASTYTIARVGPAHQDNSNTLSFPEVINVQKIAAFATPESVDMADETRTMLEVFNPAVQMNIRQISVGMSVEDLDGTTGSHTLEHVTGITFDQLSVKNVLIRSVVSDQAGTTGSVTLQYNNQMSVNDIHVRATTKQSNDPIKPYPFDDIWSGVSDIVGTTQADFESNIQPKIYSYLASLA